MFTPKSPVMKLRQMLILLIVSLLFVAVVPPPEGIADGTLGSTESAFNFCDEQYDLHILSCINDPGLYPYPYLDFYACKSTADMMHDSCIFSIPAEPDFCSIAQQRASGCGVYDPLTDFINYSECMNRSGIQFCQ